MDRRSALASILGRKQKKQKYFRIPAPPAGGLAPYTGPWEFQQAAHLLRRGMFGPSQAHINWSIEKGLAATVEKLFEELPEPAPPVNHDFPEDPFVPIGSTWIDKPYVETDMDPQRDNRRRTLYGWTVMNMLNEGISIQWKMTVFWHNHFTATFDTDPKFQYKYISLLHKNALGNIRELVKEVTVDPSMLIYLNGNDNIKNAPNENYARELLELFTIGKGPLAGPGDYTNYTEQDIKEIARILSGWTQYGLLTKTEGRTVGSAFIESRHDTGRKVLSYRFDNAVIDNMGEQEYQYLIDLIFKKSEVARAMARKLYRWFVYYEIGDVIETDVIEPLAQILIDNDFNVKPALQALLSSEHFFDSRYIGAMAKNPFDFFMTMLKTLEFSLPTDVSQQYYAGHVLYALCGELGLDFYTVPLVAGWNAYFKSPLYYRNWIDINTLIKRIEYSDIITDEGYNTRLYFVNGRFLIKPDVLKFTDSLDDPYNPDAVVEGFSNILFPLPLSAGQLKELKGVLLPGLPDYEWTNEYDAYVRNPTDKGQVSALEKRLLAMVKVILSMPEFQLG